MENCLSNLTKRISAKARIEKFELDEGLQPNHRPSPNVARIKTRRPRAARASGCRFEDARMHEVRATQQKNMVIVIIRLHNTNNSINVYSNNSITINSNSNVNSNSNRVVMITIIIIIVIIVIE